MIQENLRNLRKQRGISQEKMARILSTDTSNYSRKERGETRIHEDEWQKLADALEVSIEEIRNDVETAGNDNNNKSMHYNPYFNGAYLIIENLQDYILLLKKEIKELREENRLLKCQK